MYVLIGVLWAILCQMLEGFQAGSFSGLQQQGHALSWRFLYFSFVTLTTLGYGDVLPLTLYAQSLTYLETILGQFYLAVLVAALVSAYLSDRDCGLDAEARDRPVEVEHCKVEKVIGHIFEIIDTLPNSFTGESLGYVGISNIPYNDEGWGLNTLYWDQKFQGGRYEVVAGYLDISDYVDIHPLPSPWTGFFNYAFSIGAGALDIANDGALGFGGAAWLTESVYAMAGLVDQNSDATDPLEGFSTFSMTASTSST